MFIHTHTHAQALKAAGQICLFGADVMIEDDPSCSHEYTFYIQPLTSKRRYVCVCVFVCVYVCYIFSLKQCVFLSCTNTHTHIHTYMSLFRRAHTHTHTHTRRYVMRAESKKDLDEWLKVCVCVMCM